MKLFITKSFLFSIVFAFLYLFVFIGNSYADAPIVNGYVKNSVTNAAISGVWVKWTDNIGNVRYAQTDSKGFYSFPSWQSNVWVCEGCWLVRFYETYPGFERVTPININLDGTLCTGANIYDPPTSCAWKAKVADANLGNPGAGFGCDQKPNTFTVVLPYNFGGSFSTLVLDDSFNPINNAIPTQDIPDLFYTPPPVVLSGRVTDNANKPLSGVTVVIDPTCSYFPNSATTNSGGKFSFPSVPYGTFFCIRAPTVISGYTLSSNNYECQTAGGFFDPDICGNVPSIDVAPDNAYNFTYTPIPTATPTPTSVLTPTATPTPTSVLTPTATPTPSIANLIIVPDSASGGVEGGSYGLSGLTTAEGGSNYYNSLEITIETNNVTAANTNLLAMAFTSPTSAPADQSLYELTRNAYLGNGFVLVSAVQTRTLVGYYTGTSSSFQDFAAGNYYLYFNGTWDVISACYVYLRLPELSVCVKASSSNTKPIFSVTLNKAIGSRSWATHKYLMDRSGAEFRSQSPVCNDKVGINKACTTASIPVAVASSPKKESGILAYFKKLLAFYN